MEEGLTEKSAANAVAAELGADVLLYSGGITQDDWVRAVTLVRKRTRRHSKVLLVLITPGGDPDAAFKIGRCLQEKYPKGGVYAFIPGWCKSAGTLLALASSRFYIGDFGELGPLDIQLAKADEIYEMGSGLLIDAAMKTLEQTAQKMFINFLYGIRTDTRGGITTRTAAELASNMVAKLLAPIYQQIEPIKIGENNRAMNITKSYGLRLNRLSNILRDPKSLEFLVQSYPDHGFAIDRMEAGVLFKDVKEPPESMVRLSDVLGERAITPKDGKAEIGFLSDEPTVPHGTAETKEAEVEKGGRNGRAKSNGRRPRNGPEQPAGTA